MQDWTREIIEQICTGEIILEGNLESGNRLALIVIDNAVEFALKHYAARNTSFTQLRSNEAFYQIISKIENDNITIDEAKDIRAYHGIRNTLYHEGKLITVKSSVVTEYAKLAKVVLAQVLDYKLDDKGWKTERSKVRELLLDSKDEGGVLESVHYETKEIDGIQAIKMTIYSETTTFNEILLVINGFNSNYGREPSRLELETSFAISNVVVPPRDFSMLLSKLRTTKRLQREKISLSASALRVLRKKFQL